MNKKSVEKVKITITKKHVIRFSDKHVLTLITGDECIAEYYPASDRYFIMKDKIAYRLNPENFKLGWDF
jgi:hypothetical protein